MSEFISRAQAQKLLGCNRDTILELLRSGVIASSRKENGGWLVSYDSLEEYMASSWPIREESVPALQQAIAQLEKENTRLKALLKEYGIDYEADDAKTKDSSADDISIADLGLNDRALVALGRTGIHSIDLLRKMTMKDLMSIEGIGKKTATAIKSKLLKNGLALRKY